VLNNGAGPDVEVKITAMRGVESNLSTGQHKDAVLTVVQQHASSYRSCVHVAPPQTIHANGACDTAPEMEKQRGAGEGGVKENGNPGADKCHSHYNVAVLQVREAHILTCVTISF
jgi:hypothetical protein